MNPDASFMYGPDDYFAFVESMEPVATRRTLPQNSTEDITGRLLVARDRLGLSAPGTAVWLDCVQSRYLLQLPWRNEVCREGSADDAARRRKQIRALDRSKFRVGLLFIDARNDAESATALAFSRTAWHRVTLLNQAEGIPIMMDADFDIGIDTGDMRFLRYLTQCSSGELRSLLNVFNLDFIPTASFGNDQRGDQKAPPIKPKPAEQILPHRELVYANHTHDDQLSLTQPFLSQEG